VWTTGPSHRARHPGTRSDEPVVHLPEPLPGLRAARDYGRAVLRWLSALVIAGIVSAFAVLLLTGHYVTEGPVLLRLGEDHGVHLGDVFVVVGWAVALLAEAGLLLVGTRTSD
jgi:hypothetical protein